MAANPRTWNNANNDDAFFGGASAGTVTVSGTVKVDDVTFTTSGYTFTGGTIKFAGNSVITATSGTQTINSNITGSNGFTLDGAGSVLVLGSNEGNTYSGDTTILGGTLQGGATRAFSDASTYNIVNGTIDLGGYNQRLGGLSSSDPLVVTSNAIVSNSGADATLRVGVNDSSTTFYGVIQDGAGAVALKKFGTGTFTLAGANTFSGETTITGGTLQIGDGGTRGSIGTGAITNDAIIVFNRSDVITSANLISGTGSLTQAGAGTLVLTADNTYAGGTTINSGATLQVGSGGATGAIGSGAVTNNGTLVVSRTGTLEISAVISGDGAVQQQGSGILSLSGSNTYTGGTTVGDGTLRLANNTAAGTGAITGQGGRIEYANGVAIDNQIILDSSNTRLRVVTGDTATQSGDIYEVNPLTPLIKSGGGTLILTGENTYTGGTTVRRGTLQIGDGGTTGTLGSGDVVNNGSLVFKRADVVTVAGVISGTGSLTQAGSGTLVLTGDNTYSGGTTITAGTLSLQTNTAAGTGAITTQGSVVDYANGVTIANLVVIDSNTTELQALTGAATQSGAVSELNGPRPLAKTGAGTLTLSGANSYTGPTTVAAGELVLASTNASKQYNVDVGATLTLSGSASLGQGAGVTGNSGTPGTRGGTFNIGGAAPATFDASNYGSLYNLAAVNINTGSTFLAESGSGIDANTVTNSGTLNLRGVGGTELPFTATINGDYVQTSSGKLEVNIGGTPATSSQLVVGGNVTLAGTLDVASAPGQYYSGQKLTIIDYAGSRSGEFDTVSIDVPDFKAGAFYGGDGGSVEIMLAPDLIKGDTGLKDFVPAALVTQTVVNPRQNSTNEAFLVSSKASVNVNQSAPNELNVFGASTSFVSVGPSFGVVQNTTDTVFNTDAYSQRSNNQLGAIASSGPARAAGSQIATNAVNSVGVQAPQGAIGVVSQSSDSLGFSTMAATNSLLAIAGLGSAASVGTPVSTSIQSASNAINTTFVINRGQTTLGLVQSLGGAGGFSEGYGDPIVPPAGGLSVQAYNTAQAISSAASSVDGVVQQASYVANVAVAIAPAVVLSGSQNATVLSYVDSRNSIVAVGTSAEAVNVSQSASFGINIVFGTGLIAAGTSGGSPFLQVVQPIADLNLGQTSQPPGFVPQGQPPQANYTVNTIVAVGSLGSADISGMGPDSQSIRFELNSFGALGMIAGGVQQNPNDQSHTNLPVFQNSVVAVAGAGTSTISNVGQSQYQSINSISAGSTTLGSFTQTGGPVSTSMAANNSQLAVGGETSAIVGASQSNAVMLNSAGLGASVGTTLNQTAGLSNLTSTNLLTSNGSSLATIADAAQVGRVGVNTGSASALLGTTVNQTAGLTALTVSNTLSTSTAFNASVSGSQSANTALNVLR